MRLRLDKLVLSAGLALAMVATTIPVMPVKAAETVTATSPITAGVYSGSSAVTLSTDTSFISAVTGVSTATSTPVTSGASSITKSVALGTVTASTLTTALTENSSDSAIASYLTNNSLTAVGTSTLAPAALSLQQVDSYTASYTYTVTEADVTAAKTYTALIATAEETAAAELKAVTGSTAAATSVTGGTKTVTVADGTATPTVKASGATVESANYGNVAAEGATITVETTDASVTNVYTITDLSSFGYTVKNAVTVSSTDVDAGAVVYKVLKVTTASDNSKSVSEVESTLADGVLTYEITDLASKYMIAYSVESTSKALITDTTYEGTDYTVTIGQVATPGSDDAKTGFATYVEENSATLVGYLDIDVTAGGNAVTYTDTPITFTIDVPVDVESGVTYKVLRFHDGKVEALDTTVADDVITFSSDLFSDFALVTVAADTTTTDTTEEATDSTTDSATDSTTSATTDSTSATTDSTSATTADSSTTSTKASENTGDNSMMPLFMTTLLLALCAGSLAIYKEKKTN